MKRPHHTAACWEVLEDPGASCICRPPATIEPMVDAHLKARKVSNRSTTEGRGQTMTTEIAEVREILAGHGRAQVCTLDAAEVEFEAAYRENAERDRAALRMMLIRLKRFAGVATWHQEIERVLDRTADGVPPGRHTAPVPTTGGKK